MANVDDLFELSSPSCPSCRPSQGTTIRTSPSQIASKFDHFARIMTPKQREAFSSQCSPKSACSSVFGASFLSWMSMAAFYAENLVVQRG
jgi:hypothetical protein